MYKFNIVFINTFYIYFLTVKLVSLKITKPNGSVLQNIIQFLRLKKIVSLNYFVNIQFEKNLLNFFHFPLLCFLIRFNTYIRYKLHAI